VKAADFSVNREIPVPRRGVMHAVSAAGYSLAGLRRLMQETAARLELAGTAGGGLLLLARGASAGQCLIFAALCCAVLAVEALNTALEVLTDRISPEWSVEAKHAKDLGSLAVALTLCVAGGYLAAVMVGGV